MLKEEMKPRIFVSSTFYDLKYIREDLSNFIKYVMQFLSA